MGDYKGSRRDQVYQAGGGGVTGQVQELTAEGIRDLVGRAPVLLEIGCNDGTDTWLFLDAMPGATIYCFEPDQRAAKRFRAAPRSKRVDLFEVAVGDVDGPAVFYASSGQVPAEQRRPGGPACLLLDEWDLSGSLRKPTGHLQYSSWTTFPDDKQCEVEVVRLDTWLEKHSAIDGIDFIWADVQGAEDALVRGGKVALSKTRYFYTEFYDTPLYENQVSLATLQAMLPDFETLGIYGNNVLFKNRRCCADT